MVLKTTHEEPAPAELGKEIVQGAPVGVSVIVLYKLAKAGVQLTLAAVLVVLLAGGLTTELHDFAVHLAKDGTSAWSVALAKLLVRVTTKSGVHLAIAALVADAALSFFEGWSLHRRFWWAPWLIVIATSTLLPFELVHIISRPHVGRVLLFVANLAVVVYLTRRALLEIRRQKQS
jgi:uncharacterized membrane protein (DUF2068 family)